MFEALKAVVVPDALTATVDEIFEFGSTFHAYDLLGGMDPVALIGEPIKEDWHRSGDLPSDLDTLRVALFWEWRWWHWNREQSYEPPADGYMRDLVAAIKEASGGAVPVLNLEAIGGTVLHGRTLWPELTARVALAGKCRAAIAYAGPAASRLLPFKAGDELTVNSSLAAVRSGATAPATVRSWLRQGVTVRGRGDLHAKVLLIDADGARTAIVGSANASHNSAHYLLEAALATSDAATCKETVAFLDEVAEGAAVLAEDWCDDMEGQYGLDRTAHGAPPGTDAHQPSNPYEPWPTRLYVISTGWYQPDEEEMSGGVAEQEEVALLGISPEDAGLDWWLLEEKSPFQVGDMVVGLHGPEAWPPARVVHLGARDGSGKRRIHVLSDPNLETIAFPDLQNEAGPLAKDRALTGEKLDKVLGAWGLVRPS